MRIFPEFPTGNGKIDLIFLSVPYPYYPSFQLSDSVYPLFLERMLC